MVKSLFVIWLILLLFLSMESRAQSTLSGEVLSSKDSLPLTGVTILNKRSGFAATSDDKGIFTIHARQGDTILLKRLGYTPLLYITDREKSGIHFRMTPQPIELKSVTVMHYHLLKDSLRLREEFRRSFDFRRPRWNEVVPYVGIGFAININQLSKALAFKSNRRKEKFRGLLFEKEKENLVEARFTPEVVTKVTGMQGDSVTQFMQKFAPHYDFVKNATTYDLYEYIKQQYLKYISSRDTVGKFPANIYTDSILLK